MTDVVMKVEDLTRTYQMGEVQVQAVRGVSFSIERGDMVALMGPSGSGKSTTMNTLGCLDRPTSGHYWLDGTDVSNLRKDELAAIRNQKLGFVFQGFNLLSRTSAVENVELPLMYGHPASARERRERAMECLRLVGLEKRFDHVPAQLSGGEQQRVAIARALVNRPSLILADEPNGNLDSARSVEIMALFQWLNANQGITIVMVTHESDIATHCRRVLRFKDGVLVTDEAVNQVKLAAPDSVVRGMIRLMMILRVAWRALGRNKVRTFLTMLGIIIGVAAVIAMVALGQGAQDQVQQTIASMGTNVIQMYSSSSNIGGVRGGSASVQNLTAADCDAIRTECPSVIYVSPIVYTNFQVSYSGQNWSTTTRGVAPDYFGIRSWPVSSGTAFNKVHVDGGARVCVIGQTIADKLFPNQDPLGKFIRIRGVQFQVLGVLTRKGANAWGSDQDDLILAPYTAVMKHLNHYNYIGSISISATSGDRVDVAMSEVTALMRQRHHIKEGNGNDFEMFSYKEMLQKKKDSEQVFTYLLGGVASVSLVVGGIGIMNIMLVSVTERIREIGTRMAVGARQSDILLQFFVEALVMSMIGGLLGIGLGMLTSHLSNEYWMPTVVSVDSVVLAFVCSAAVGIFFGFYPALKASQLDPIDALRHE